jgi:hypothetical protein
MEHTDPSWENSCAFTFDRHTGSPSPAECPLVEAVLAGCFLYELP